MKKKAARIVFLLSAAVVLATVMIFVHVHTALSVDTEVEALVKVDVFAFGPIYDEGIIADGERSLQKILVGAHPVSRLLAVMETGSPEAQAYALVGLHQLQPEEFERRSAVFKFYPGRINSVSGCIVESLERDRLITEIQSGRFSQSLKQANGG